MFPLSSWIHTCIIKPLLEAKDLSPSERILFSRDEQDRASQLSFDIYSSISVSNNTVLTQESVRILEHTLIQTYHNSLTIFKTVPTTSSARTLSER